MRFNKLITRYILVTLGLILLLTNQATAQESTSYSWSDSISKGDKFTWRINSVVENYEYLNEVNNSVSTQQVNSTSSQLNETVTTTVTISDVTSTNAETTTIVETTTDSSGYDYEITNGSIVTIEVIKDLNDLILNDPLFDNEWYGETSPTYEYFDYRIDGEINYYLFPAYIMIVPVKTHNGVENNFFEHQVVLGEDGELGGFGNLTIENGVFTLKEDQISHDNFSSSGSVTEVRWDVDSGLLLSFAQSTYYSDPYSKENYELEISLEDVTNNTPDVELELPVSMLSIISILLIPILRKMRKNS